MDLAFVSDEVKPVPARERSRIDPEPLPYVGLGLVDEVDHARPGHRVPQRHLDALALQREGHHIRWLRLDLEEARLLVRALGANRLRREPEIARGTAGFPQALAWPGPARLGGNDTAVGNVDPTLPVPGLLRAGALGKDAPSHLDAEFAPDVLAIARDVPRSVVAVGGDHTVVPDKLDAVHGVPAPHPRLAVNRSLRLDLRPHRRAVDRKVERNPIAAHAVDPPRGEGLPERCPCERLGVARHEPPAVDPGKAVVAIVRADDPEPVARGQAVLDGAACVARSHAHVASQPHPFLVRLRTAVVGQDLREGAQSRVVDRPILAANARPVARVVRDHEGLQASLTDLAIEFRERVAADQGLVILDIEDVVIPRRRIPLPLVPAESHKLTGIVVGRRQIADRTPLRVDLLLGMPVLHREAVVPLEIRPGVLRVVGDWPEVQHRPGILNRLVQTVEMGGPQVGVGIPPE